jgi:hypothetical protein
MRRSFMSDMGMHYRYFGPWRTGARIALFAVLGVIGAALFALVFGWLVMLLWNWLMPPIFGLGQIGFWQAFGIVILAKLVFGAVGMGGHRPYGKRHAPPWRKPGDGGSDNPWERWRHYDEFWREEGKEAFQRFMERKKTGGETPTDQKA